MEKVAQVYQAQQQCICKLEQQKKKSVLLDVLNLAKNRDCDTFITATKNKTASSVK